MAVFMTFSAPASDAVVVSVVSHGHGPTVQPLLYALAAGVQGGASSVRRVVLTLNIPEPEPLPPPGGWPFVLQIIHNGCAIGFGANHNRALAAAAEPFVCVLNPDVVLAGGDPFAALVQAAAAPGAGCAYPLQVDAQGQLQDSQRELPTPQALLRRRAFGRRERRVDWVNAACIVLPQPVWQGIGGFDESYFMYCEDVDLCLRVRLAGFALVQAPVQIEHSGQRASHQRWTHLRWHLSSLWRLWRSPVYRQARLLCRGAAQRPGAMGASS